jgi:hypothetical protein
VVPPSLSPRRLELWVVRSNPARVQGDFLLKKYDKNKKSNSLNALYHIGSFSLPNAMANSPAKVAAMTFTVVAGIIVTPASFYIIHFEKDKHHRTLINQVKKSRHPTSVARLSEFSRMYIGYYFIWPIK